jgi:single-strand DNA-binding protein
MASLNKTILIGNLTRAPELRYTPSGTAVGNMTLAVNRRYSVNGETREEVLFIGIVAWGKTAENCSQYLDKGSALMVEGRLQSRDWTGKDGQKHKVIEVVAENVQFLGAKKKETASRDVGAPAADDPGYAEPGADGDVPF